MSETSEVPPPTKTEVEAKASKLTEKQTETIKKAMLQVDGIYDSARQITTKDRQFADEVSPHLNKMRSETTNANPKEPGYHQANEQAGRVVGLISAKLRETVDEAVKMGAGQVVNRNQIESLLNRAAIESDSQKAEALVEEAKYKLGRITNEMQRQRESNQARRLICKRSASENEDQARYLYFRLPENTRRQIEGGLLHRYNLNSRRLAETVTEKAQHLQAADQNFLNQIHGCETAFKQTVNQLLDSSN